MADTGQEELNANENNEQLVPKKSSTSGIWDYFGFRREDVAQSQVLCKTCRKIVATSRGNTTNLHSHMEHNHKTLYEDFKTAKTTKAKASGTKATPQATINDSFANVTPYEKSSKRHKTMTAAVARYVAKCMVPLSTVEKEAFLDLMREADRRYQVPSRTYFSQVAFPQMYESCVATVKTELGQVDFFASTTDIWSSRTTEPFLSFTVHFLNHDFSLTTRCLEVAYFPESHTGENIALRDVLANWGLKEEKQVTITTDNGANVVKATELNKWVRLQAIGEFLFIFYTV